ncbi:LIN-24 (Twenty-four) Like [Brachionus plicatilis]|uniref:LIN-24 (Twenty-four) Like n=1 Tax=Brachionus plicatilis TaxID=10195 RepID=A0A3M7S9L1_BRAPC|nr:LIN-24 (Twenty-four) Like [Brachionus plicatilis]
MNSLIGKINKDPHFGKDQEYRNFYDGNRCDSALSGESCNSADSPSGDKVIVDLDAIIEKWAMNMWEKTKTKQTAKCDFEDLDILVNWKKVDMVQDDAKFEQTNPIRKTPQQHTLFKTYFTNRTNQDQEYSFKTERTTRQSCGFNFTKGFSREKEGEIKFKFPNEIVEIGGGIRSEHSVECGKDQTKEEEITWGVDSIIKVKPKSRTCASLVINELELTRNFSVETRLKGRLTVTLNNRKDNQFVKLFSHDIVEIIRQAMDKYWLPPNSCIFEIIEVNGTKYARTNKRNKQIFFEKNKISELTQYN